MALKFEEYRGIKNLVVASLTETVNQQTGEVTETYGTVQPLSGVQQVSGEVNEETETHYYDDMAAIVVDSEGEDTYTLVVSIPSKKTRALIEGTTFDENTGALIGSKKKKQYFAMGFIADKLNGVEEYNWIYKGKFTGGNKEHNTKDDGTDATNMEYTFTSIHTATKYTKANGGNCKYLSVDDDGKADLTTFFDTVTTPDDLTAKA
jgi:phi13 family phage major tail protein